MYNTQKTVNSEVDCAVQLKVLQMCKLKVERDMLSVRFKVKVQKTQICKLEFTAGSR